MTGINWNFKP